MNGLLVAAALLAQEPGLEAKPAGTAFPLDGRSVTLRRIDLVPLVENEYSRVFAFDSYENPKLRELREKNRLDEVVAGGKEEFDRQVLLLDWAYHRIRKFGRPSADPKGALEILKAVDEGHTFFCAHYGDVLVSAAASLGWVDRALALRRPNHLGSGSTEHTITEIWSNQHRKWVMLDPTFAMYVERDGVPLNAYEIRESWFARDGKDLSFVLGAERKKHRREDLPVFRARHAGFGDLLLDADGMHKYAFLGYVPNTNFMDAGKDYGRMFITQDKVCEGTSWHKRKNPKDPAREPYFPIQQAALSLAPGRGLALEVAIRTLTPNFKAFKVRIDQKEWAESPASFTWTLHPGANRLEALSVNRFGVEGPPSLVELEVAR
jgi:hypothetical protein